MNELGNLKPRGAYIHLSLRESLNPETKRVLEEHSPS